MISSKIFNANGTNKRFLSDFIIQSEQFTRVYVYIYDNTLNPDGSQDQLQNGSTLQSDWSYPDNIWKRGANVPNSGNDLITIDKWDLVTNSILFYDAPLAPSRVWIEVATAPEEFGNTLTQPSVERAETAAANAVVAQAAADAALVSALAAQAAAEAAELAAGGSSTGSEAAQLAAEAAAAAALASQTAAAASAAAASLSETNSAASAAAALASQTASAASAAAALISEGNASASAIASAASAAAALASQTAAAASAAAASASEIAAAASAAAAALSEANIGTAISDEIGVTIQGYDANTVKYDVAGKFSTAQRTSATAEDNNIDFTANNDFTITLGVSLTVTVGVITGCDGQAGSIVIADVQNIAGWLGFTWLGTAPTLTTGVGMFSYKIIGSTVYIVKVENA